MLLLMMPSTKLFLLSFLLTASAYALILIIYDLISGNESSFWEYLIMPFISGLFMALMIVSFQKSKLKNDGDLAITETKIVKSTLTIEALLKRLKTDSKLGKMKVKEIENGVLLVSGITWKSWGENIQITLETDEDFEFVYHLSSSPRLKTTLIDYGKNLENINRIEKVLS